MQLSACQLLPWDTDRLSIVPLHLQQRLLYNLKPNFTVTDSDKETSVLILEKGRTLFLIAVIF